MKQQVFLILFTLLFSGLTYAQYEQEMISYDKTAARTRHPIKHRTNTESATKYHKRINRIIDVRQKQNLPLQWPKAPLHKVIFDAVTNPDNRGDNGLVKAYQTDELQDSLTYTVKEVESRGSDTFYTQVESPPGSGNFIDTAIAYPFERDQIKKYEVMEDWIFDSKYSDFRPRIIAVAPIFDLTTSGISIGEARMFWVKWEDIQPVMARYETFNPYNDAARLSYNDWFEMRMFASYITKESNVWDMPFKYYEENESNPFKALLAGVEAKNDLFVFEHDLWEY